jgi:PAS domain S-box-containing protein
MEVNRISKLQAELLEARNLITRLQQENEILHNQVYPTARDNNFDYRFLFASMPQGVTYQDAHGQIVHVNPAAEKILGLTFDQLRGVTSIDPRWRSIHEDGSPFPGEEHPAMVSLKTGKKVNDVIMGVFNPLEGRNRWILINSVPLTAPDHEEPYLIQTTFVDITDRKRSEDLLQIRLKFSEIAELTTLEDAIVFALDQAENLTGSKIGFFHLINVSLNEIQLQAWSTNTLKDGGSMPGLNGHFSIEEAGIWADCVRTKKPVIHNNVKNEPHQEGVPVDRPEIIRELSMPIIQNGLVVAVIGVGNKQADYDQIDLDVVETIGDLIFEALEKNRIEQALVENEAKYRLLAENMVDVIWIMDIQKRNFTYMSPSIIHLLGYTPDEMLSKPLEEFTASHSMERVDQDLPERIMKFTRGDISTKIQRDEIDLLHRSGTLIHTEIISTILTNEIGLPIEIIGVTRDITERKKAELTLLKREAQIRSLYDSMTEMLALHELVYDDSGHPIDYRIVDCNPAYTLVTGISHNQAVGALASQLYGTGTAPYLDIYARVAETQEPHHFEVTFSPMERTFDISAFSPEKGRFATVTTDVTEKRRTEKQLAESQRQQLTLLSNLPGMAYRCKNDPDWPMEFVSEGSYTLCGYKPESIIRNSEISFREIIHPDDREMVWNSIQSRVETDEPYQLTYRIVLPDKSVKWVWEQGRMVKAPEDEFVALEGLILDINDRIEAEEALKESEKKFRSYIEHATVGVFITDQNGKYLEVNQTGCKMLGYSMPELLNLSIPDILNQDSQEAGMQHFQALLTTGHAQSDIPLMRKDGSTFWATVSGVRLSKNRYMAYCQDIDERKKIEKALYEREQYLNTILQTAFDGFFIINLQGDFLEVNEAFSRNTGYTREELLTMNLNAIEAIETSEDILSHIQLIQKTGHGRFITQHRKKNNEVIDIEVGAKFVNLNDGQIVSFCRDITAQIKAVEALRASEEKYRSLIESQESVIATVDFNGNFHYMNQIAAESLHGQPGEFVGKNMYQLFPEEIAKSQLKNIQQVINSGEGLTNESRSVVAGKPRWFRTSIQPIFGQEGNATLALINSVDITERKEIELVLEEKVIQRTFEIETIRKRLQLATQSAGIGIWEWNLETNQLVWDEQMYSIYGVQPNQLADQPIDWRRFIYPHDKKVIDQLMDSTKNKSMFEAEFRIVWPDQSIRTIQANSFTLLDEKDKPTRIVGVNIDITSKKEQENELRSRENLYRALFENSNDAIILMTPSGSIWRANQKAFDLLGYQEKKFNKMTFYELVIKDEQAEAANYLSTIIMGGEPAIREQIFLHKQGFPVNVEINSSPVKDSDGKINLIQSVVRDITPRKKAEALLRESEETLRFANAELARANRSKDEFLANVSHELRTPLNNILALSETLLEQTRGPLNDKQKKSIVNIESSGRHLLSLINDILDLSKIESQKMDLVIDNFLAKEIAQSSISFIKEPALKKSIQVICHMIDPDLQIRGDGRRIKQIIVNLLSNAVKFTPKGGQIELSIQADSKKKEVHFSVKDNGIGIKPEDQKKLFKPFEQLDSSLARHYEGTGLGLALVYRLTQMHGGTVSVESEFGKGSIFTITIPQSNE